MGMSVFLSFILYAVVTASTPGPNNILLLNAMLNYGYKGSKGIIAGVYIGFAAVMIICGVASNALIAILPSLLVYLKILGVVYILYLAYKVAISKPPNIESKADKIGFRAAFILQFVNVKIILYGITIQTAFVLPYDDSLVISAAFVLLSIIIGFAGPLLWIFAGAVLRKLLMRYYKVANVIMALLLVISAIGIVI